MSPRQLAAALALTVLVNPLTAGAEEPAAADAPIQTPLSLRPTAKTAEVGAPTAPHMAGWPIALVGVVAGGAALLWRSRRGSPRATRELAILRRLSVGLRSELLVVNVEGQRMLIGVTPQSIQSIATLDAEEPEPGPYAAAPRPIPDRLDALLELDPRPSPRGRSSDVEAPRALATALGDADLGQARGLASLRKRR